jgi:hypothetical protein
LDTPVGLRLKVIIQTIIVLLLVLPVNGCKDSRREQMVKAGPQTNNANSIERSAGIDHGANTQSPEAQFQNLYVEWRKKRIDISMPVINSYYPSYTNNPEFQKIQSMGLQALPMMEDRLRKLQNGSSDYKTKNWCDVCFVYAILDLKKWDPHEISGDTEKVGWTNDMGAYCKLILDRLDGERKDIKH